MDMKQPSKNNPAEELSCLRARVAELERSEARLRESEQQFPELFSQSRTGLASYDADGRLVHANKAYLEMAGLADVLPVKGRSFFDNPSIPEAMKENLRKGQPAQFEYGFGFAKVKADNLSTATKSGIFRLNTLVEPIWGEGADRPAGYLSQIQDVTEGAKREAQLDRLNRTLKARSRSIQAMLHATDELEYLQEVCRIIVGDCGHKLIWIGFAEEDEGKTVRPVAYSGFEEGYIERLNITWAETERGRGPTGTTIRTGKPTGCRNMLTDPDFAPWRKDALERGYASSVALPLLSGERAFGAITIYAAEPEAFSETETQLLCEMADDLAFGITALRLRSAHAKAGEEVQSLALFPDEDPNPILRISKDGTILYANKAGAGALDFWKGRFGMGAYRKIHQRVLAVLNSGAAKNVEIHCGDRVFFFTFAPIVNRGYVNLYGHNVTKHKAADDRLRESEEMFHAIFDNAPTGIVLGDTQGRLWEANPAFLEMLGYTSGELRGRSVLEITHPDDRQAEEESLPQLIAGKRTPMRVEKRYVHKDGRVVFVRLMRSLCRDAAGKPQFIIGMAEDITARKQAEEALQSAYRELEQRVRDRTAELVKANEGLQAEIAQRQRVENALRESEERYRALFEDSPVAVVEYDCHGLMEYLNQLKLQGIADVREYMESHSEEAARCLATLIPLHANRAAVRLLNAADRDHLLKNLPSTLHDETRGYFRTALSFLASGRTPLEAETVLHTLTGEKKEVWISSSFIAGRGNRHPTALVATADLTELREAERELDRQKQAAQLQRMESLTVTGRLAAGVAHEVNNPLQGIVAQLDLLSLELPARFRKGRRIKLIRESVEKIAKIVKNLLCLHRPPQEDEASCSASLVVRSVTDLILSQAMSRQVRVDVSITPPDATIPLSTVRLTQVLLNLILNALDATPSGGVIEVEVTQAQEQTLLLVSDTGSGISPEHRSQLFSPFFTTKGPSGTGLGLSVTHSLITEAGGTIDVADREGGGTTFFVRFPGGHSHQTDVSA